MQIFLIPRFLSTPRVASWITCSSKILLLTYRFCIDEQVKHFIIIIIIIIIIINLLFREHKADSVKHR